MFKTMRCKASSICSSNRPAVRVSKRSLALVIKAQQTALITGSSTGIGRETSAALAQKGWKVFAGVRTESDAGRLQQLHECIKPVLIDVTSPDSIAAAAERIQQELCGTGLDLLVNNAGVALVAPVEHVPLQTWRQVLDVNLQGPLAVVQAFLPMLRQAQPQRGRIINISSVAGHLALPFWSAYNVSKAGLDMLSECLRYELADQGITVVLIKPGPIQTPIWDKSRQKSQAVVGGLPADAQQLYGAALDKMTVVSQQIEQDALPVSDLVHLIVEAVTATSPQPVYIIGKDASLIYWAKRFVPDTLWARIMLQSLKK